MTKFQLSLAAATLLALSTAATAGGANITAIRVVEGLQRPVWVTAPPGDFHRVFVLEQPGRIRIVRDGALLETPFLDIDPIVLGGVSLFDERGLLGLAFHPEYAENGLFYVYYSALNNNTVLARYQVSADADVADPNSALIMMTFVQPPGFPNHKCGWLAFGPDGFLYIGAGDGGSANDPGGRAQDITNQWLGKLLRIDVNGDDFPEDASRNYAVPTGNPFVGLVGDDEIWAYGLRNPWRNSFDPETGELFIADVGQDVQEEINIQPAFSPGGQNYGWRCMEGNLCTGLSGCTCNAPNLTLPIHTYNHVDGRCSITGGEVYRGCALPDLHGAYFFADYCSGEFWTLTRDGANVAVTDRTAELTPAGGLAITAPSSFGRDAYGELYICDRNDGEVYRIVPAVLSNDCNGNGVHDACDILDGSSVDKDESGVPDECEQPISIVSSNPPDGAIDARQPSNIDGTNPTGWQTVDLTFDGVVVNVLPGDFAVTQEGGVGPAPTVLGTVPLSDFEIRVILSESVEPLARTSIHHDPSATSVQLGYLPGDVNGDGTTAPVDILSLIDSLNGVGVPRAIWSTDIDRSGVAQPADILRLIDLLNGAEAFEIYNGASLP